MTPTSSREVQGFYYPVKPEDHAGANSEHASSSSFNQTGDLESISQYTDARALQVQRYNEADSSIGSFHGHHYDSGQGVPSDGQPQATSLTSGQSGPATLPSTAWVPPGHRASQHGAANPNAAFPGTHYGPQPGRGIYEAPAPPSSAASSYQRPMPSLNPHGSNPTAASRYGDMNSSGYQRPMPSLGGYSDQAAPYQTPGSAAYQPTQSSFAAGLQPTHGSFAAAGPSYLASGHSFAQSTNASCHVISQPVDYGSHSMAMQQPPYHGSFQQPFIGPM